MERGSSSVHRLRNVRNSRLEGVLGTTIVFPRRHRKMVAETAGERFYRRRSCIWREVSPRHLTLDVDQVTVSEPGMVVAAPVGVERNYSAPRIEDHALATLSR